MPEGQSHCSPRAWGDGWAMVVFSSLGRRVASVTQSSQSESPSCSPFGKKKKCKDKYLAKHSSSECERGSGLHPHCWPSPLPLGQMRPWKSDQTAQAPSSCALCNDNHYGSWHYAPWEAGLLSLQPMGCWLQLGSSLNCSPQLLCPQWGRDPANTLC